MSIFEPVSLVETYGGLRFANPPYGYYAGVTERSDMSSPPRRGGGFTFEVQHSGPEYFSRGFEVQAFSRRIVIRPDEISEMVI